MISGCCQSAAQRLIERTVDQRERVLVKRVNRSVQFTPRALATPGVCIVHYPSTPFWWRSFSLRKKIPPIAEAYSPRSMAAANAEPWPPPRTLPTLLTPATTSASSIAAAPSTSSTPRLFGTVDILDTEVCVRATSAWSTTHRPSRLTSLPASFKDEAVGVSCLAPFDSAGTLETTASRTQATSAWPSPSSAARSLRFRHHVSLHRRVPQPAFHCLLTLEVLLQLYVFPAFLLSQGTHQPALHFRPARNRGTEWLKSRRQQEKREKERKPEREQE